MVGPETASDPYLPWSRDFVIDPYPYYDRLRSEQPVYRSEAYGAWFVSRYSDVVAGLRDSARFSSRRLARLLAPLGGNDARARQIIERGETQMISSDAPEHARRRGLAALAFAPRQVEALRPRIRTVAEQLLADADHSGEIDLVRDFAYPLPMTVIADLLGIPREDVDRVKGWADVVASFLASGQLEVGEVDAYVQAWADLAEYLRRLARDAGRTRGDDVISLLLARMEEGRASEEEVISNLVLLAVAGHETTTNTIGTGTLVLLSNATELDRLRGDPSLLPRAVEEILRYEPVSQRSLRIARQDAEFGGHTIRAGELVHFLLGAANRDPEQFADPNRFDVSRHPNRHVTFSHGAHFCLGAQLARVELETAFSVLLTRLRRMELIEAVPAWRDNARMRGLERLLIAYQSA